MNKKKTKAKKKKNNNKGEPKHTHSKLYICVHILIALCRHKWMDTQERGEKRQGLNTNTRQYIDTLY